MQNYLATFQLRDGDSMLGTPVSKAQRALLREGIDANVQQHTTEGNDQILRISVPKDIDEQVRPRLRAILQGVQGFESVEPIEDRQIEDDDGKTKEEQEVENGAKDEENDGTLETKKPVEDSVGEREKGQAGNGTIGTVEYNGVPLAVPPGVSSIPWPQHQAKM